MGIYDNASWGGIGDELQKLDPRNIDPHQAGLAARRGLENVKGAGQTVGQIASGVAAMPRQTAAGIANTAQPYFDRQFAPMEQQANSFWQGVEDFKRGFGVGQGKPPAAQLPANRMDAYNAAKAQGDVIQDKYFKPSTGELPPAGVNMADPLPRTGPLPGKQVFNYYDQDRPASMGNPQNDPWKDMARQLATFSELRNRSQYENTGVGFLDDGADAANAEKTRRWAVEDAARNAGGNARGQIMMQGASNLNDFNANAARTQAQLVAEMMRGQNQMGVEGLRGRNQMGVEGLRGQNQLETEGLRGRNQQQNMELQYGLQAGNQAASDDRAYLRALGLEQFKQSDPNMKSSREAEAEERKARARLYSLQGDAAQQEAAYAKTPLKMMNDELTMLLKMSDSGAIPAEQVQQRYVELMAARNAYMRKNPQVQGYADGGQVETSEQLMARMREKYGLAAPAVEAPAPRPAPQQQPQPQQKPQTWAEKLRNVATGGLDRRMQGYAGGGQVSFGDDSISGLKARLAVMQNNNGASSVTAGWNDASQSKLLADAQKGNLTTTSEPPTGQFGMGLGNQGGYGSFTNSAGTSFGDGARNGIGQAYGANRDSLAAFAEGGPIDVSGRQVLGEGTPKSDSLPAIIDGEHPAALSTEEFVMPVETVRHFGLAKLNKMVEQSRKGLDTGRKSA